MEPGLYETATYRARSGNFPNGCHVCEVEIDPETGVTRVVGYWVVDNVGTVINPLLVKGQIMGGIAQGIGQVLMEDKTYDAEGQVLTGSFMDYAMPRAEDFCNVVIEDNPVPTPTNPLGVKGAGEAGTVGSLSAGVNAIVDALSVLGIAHRHALHAVQGVAGDPLNVLAYNMKRVMAISAWPHCWRPWTPKPRDTARSNQCEQTPQGASGRSGSRFSSDWCSMIAKPASH